MLTQKELDRPGIYVINNKMGLHKYVGQSYNIWRRWKKHRDLLRKNKHNNPYLQNAWNKYGERNFNLEVVEFCKDYELNDKEQYWIERLKPEYNIIKNVFEFWYTTHGKIKKEYFDNKDEEIFIRPTWHAWVYGGQDTPT
jgi:group I intron endonuclease